MLRLLPFCRAPWVADLSLPSASPLVEVALLARNNNFVGAPKKVNAPLFHKQVVCETAGRRKGEPQPQVQLPITLLWSLLI